MKQTILSGFIVFFSIQTLYGGLEPQPAHGARAISLGHAYTAVSADFWSLFQNPAGIAGLSAPMAGLYLEQRYLLPELTYGSVGMAYPFFDNQAIGLTISSFGFAAYRENLLGLAYGILLFDRLRLGTRVHYGQLAIADYGTQSVVFADIGLQTQINSQLSIGFHARNVNRSKLDISGGTEDLPTEIRAGILYHPTEKVWVIADVVKDIDHPISFRGGVEYAPVPILRMRMGVNSAPLSWNAGIGLLWQNLALDLAFGLHERLGFSPHLSLSYQFGKK